MKKLLLFVGAGVLVIGAGIVPYFPQGTDLYVHVLWPWQVMRCLDAGSLPVWFPDLNAGFGSPGIGLYSPLGPTACGVLGLILGSGGRGVRAALALAALAMVVVAPGRSRQARLTKSLCVLLSPAMLTEFFGRFPVAQLLGVPLAWLLLERAAERRWRWDRDGILFALLWLVHAPTAVMVGMISVFAVVAVGWSANQYTGDHGSAGTGRLRGAGQLVLAGLAAAGVSVWHWWPLLSAAPDFPLRSALTGGEHHPLRNLIGASGPHLPDINVAMGWAAVGLLVALLASGAWRARRGQLAVMAIVFTSLLSAPLWRHVAPLDWLQFPWRWMLPATLLAVTAILDEAPRCGRLRLAVSLAVIFVPLAGLPAAKLVSDPGLTVSTDPVDAGDRIAASFSGNPLLVDVREHRPLWWQDLGQTMALLGPRRAALVPEGGQVRVGDWRPLRRHVTVDSPAPATLVLRLLADRHWDVLVDGRPASPGRWGASEAVTVPAGRSEIEVEWRADPRAIAGALLAAMLLAAIGLHRWRLRSLSNLSEHRP